MHSTDESLHVVLNASRMGIETIIYIEEEDWTRLRRIHVGVLEVGKRYPLSRTAADGQVQLSTVKGGTSRFVMFATIWNGDGLKS